MPAWNLGLRGLERKQQMLLTIPLPAHEAAINQNKIIITTMSYTIRRIVDTHPERVNELKQKCYAINGCLLTVLNDLGPFLNEYIYQDALQILLDERQILYQREYYFSIDYRGKKIAHKHYVDFLINDEIIVECKAAEKLCIEHRQQLWNYMRLTGKQIGILFNFGPLKGQSEHYYLDTNGTMYMF